MKNGVYHTESKILLTRLKIFYKLKNFVDRFNGVIKRYVLSLAGIDWNVNSDKFYGEPLMSSWVQKSNSAV